MDKVNTRYGLVVNAKRDKPIIRLAPIDSQAKTLFGIMKGSVEIIGDIVQPVIESWEVESDD